MQSLSYASAVQLLSCHQKLTPKTIHLASSSYYLVVKNIRRTISEILKKEESFDSEIRPDLLSKYHQIVQEELRDLCVKLIGLIDENQLTMDYDNHALLDLYKIKGDYYRYIIELFPEDVSYSEYIEKAYKSYLEGEEVYNRDDSIPLSCKVSFMVNFTIFLRDNYQLHQLAYKKASECFKKISEIDYDKNDVELVKYLNLLKDNIEKWDHQDIGLGNQRKYMSYSQLHHEVKV